MVPFGWWYQIEHPFTECMHIDLAIQENPMRRPQLPLRDPKQRPLLRRNVEKLLAGSSSYVDSANFFLQVQMSEALGPGLTKMSREMRHHVITLLSQVLEPSTVGVFLSELVHRRFDLLREPEACNGFSAEEQLRELQRRGTGAVVRELEWA